MLTYLELRSTSWKWEHIKMLYQTYFRNIIIIFTEYTKENNNLFIKRIQGHFAPCFRQIPHLRFKTKEKKIIYNSTQTKYITFYVFFARMKSLIIRHS